MVRWRIRVRGRVRVTGGLVLGGGLGLGGRRRGRVKVMVRVREGIAWVKG